MKLWEKGNKLKKEVEEFTVGDDYILDQKLVKYDCLASIAHVKMLGKIGILEKGEVEEMVKELKTIIELDKGGKFSISQEQEDCHTAIEEYLTKKLGELGKKIHTGRSRNDQVMAALRLYYKEELGECEELMGKFVKGLEIFVKKYGEVELPGYTHSRKAMPSSISLWGGAFIESMKDNLKLLKVTKELIDQSPLGTGAGYGVPLKVDKEYVAKELHFKKVQPNSLYVQNSRGKFEGTLLHSLTQIMVDLNKLASDLIIFSLPQIGYFELPEEFCTGSSIMPQKKNPDVLELVRGKYWLVVANEFQVKGLIGNLLSGYNRDLQLTKKAVIESIGITKGCLEIMTLVIKNLKVNEKNCQQDLTPDVYATEKVYELVEQGIPFREAYNIVK